MQPHAIARSAFRPDGERFIVPLGDDHDFLMALSLSGIGKTRDASNPHRANSAHAWRSTGGEICSNGSWVNFLLHVLKLILHDERLKLVLMLLDQGSNGKQFLAQRACLFFRSQLISRFNCRDHRDSFNELM